MAQQRNLLEYISQIQMGEVNLSSFGTDLEVNGVPIVAGANVIGPAVSVSGDIPLFNGISGKILQDSGINFSTGNLSYTGKLSITGSSGLSLSSGSGSIVIPSTNITQFTIISNPVYINAVSGIITTVSATTSAQNIDFFTVHNNLMNATSRVYVTLIDYTGTYVTNGLPSITANSITSNSFDIIITNNHTTNALNGVLKISFLIFN